jgi:V8-like Glu-specific endopeptidase
MPEYTITIVHFAYRKQFIFIHSGENDMKTKLITRIVSFAVVAVFLVAALGFSNAPVTANTAIQAENGDIRSPASLVVAASVPWTKAQMLAAKPYPLQNEAIQTESANLSSNPPAPSGLAGSVAGKLPTKAVGKGTTPSLLGNAPALLDEETLAGVDLMGYSYPAPFTRQYIDAISYSSWYPFRTVGKLFFNQGRGSYVCSASVIGYAGIATAGHCVHSGNNKASGWSTNMVFVPAYYNGSAPYGQWPVFSLITKSVWFQNGNPGGLRRDIGAGLIHRNDSGYRLGDYTGYLGYAWGQGYNQHWWEIGYPQASPFTGAYMVACQSSFAYTATYGISGPLTMGVGCDMTGGSSGGPWVKSLGTGNYVNGVNSYKRNGYPKEMFSPYIDSVNKTPWDTARAYAP